MKPVGNIAWIGPLFKSGEGPCWECLEQRIVYNKQMETFVMQKTQKEHPLITSISSYSITNNLVLNITVLEVIKWLTLHVNKNIEDNILTVDFNSLKFDNHYVVKRPQCITCGSPHFYSPTRAPKSINLFLIFFLK